MTMQSTPLCSSPIAALCLNTCGLTRLLFSVGQLSDATLTYLRTIRLDSVTTEAFATIAHKQRFVVPLRPAP